MRVRSASRDRSASGIRRIGRDANDLARASEFQAGDDLLAREGRRGPDLSIAGLAHQRERFSIQY